MEFHEAFYIEKKGIFAVPIIHFCMEMAAQVKMAYDAIKPDCIAVELPETMQAALIHAASRLPDISVVVTYDQLHHPIYFLSEPCEPSFEGLRCGLENQVPTFCIDLDIDNYPDFYEPLPDPYSIHRIGLKAYYEHYLKSTKLNALPRHKLDLEREIFMARRLKELSLSYDRILFISGMSHVDRVLKLTDNNSFPELKHAKREAIQLCTVTEESCRDIMAEWGWLTTKYEQQRANISKEGLPDRQKVIYQLYKAGSEKYVEKTGNAFPGYNLRNIMKFARNYALIDNQLMPDLFKILTAAKGSVDHNYAYHVWDLATTYPYLRNVDSLIELDLSVEDIWGKSKLIRFHMTEKGRKNSFFDRKRKDSQALRFKPPSPFSICSFPPEDIAIEKFGDFLKKKGTQLLTDDASRTIPFSTSLEDGIDTRETIRHWHEKKLYVKAKGKPPGGVGSICIIFDEDKPIEGKKYEEKYPWLTTWLGEHSQESDMSFYATSIAKQVVGPGISRCEYGGFMMSYPPRRLEDVWSDPDYSECRSKSEVLLMAAIDYAVKPMIVYVASNPPRTILKSFARRFGKKIVYIPIGQLSPITLNKLRMFHVLDGHNRREVAGDYIF